MIIHLIIPWPMYLLVITISISEWDSLKHSSHCSFFQVAAATARDICLLVQRGLLTGLNFTIFVNWEILHFGHACLKIINQSCQSLKSSRARNITTQHVYDRFYCTGKSCTIQWYPHFSIKLMDHMTLIIPLELSESISLL